MVDALIQSGVSADQARLVYVMLNFAGADVRQDDLFANESFFSKGKSALKGLKVGLEVISVLIAGSGKCVHAAHSSSGSNA